MEFKNVQFIIIIGLTCTIILAVIFHAIGHNALFQLVFSFLLTLAFWLFPALLIFIDRIHKSKPRISNLMEWDKKQMRKYEELRFLAKCFFDYSEDFRVWMQFDFRFSDTYLEQALASFPCIFMYLIEINRSLNEKEEMI